MSASDPTTPPVCARTGRDLSGEKPVRLPDGRIYSAEACERMATEAFEMETGETFVKWIEKHPVLVMQHQPGEMYVRRVGFVFPLVCALLGLLVTFFGLYRVISPPPAPVSEAAPAEVTDATRSDRGARTPAPMPPASGWSYVLIGGVAALGFGWLALRQGLAFLRAVGFRLTLEDGGFTLQKGPHTERFHIDDVTQACVVRPGTVGATEGALALKDGRMLTLDTCLTDLHALGVVMDLRFREDYPPSVEDQMRDRREKLRKIRGLKD